MSKAKELATRFMEQWQHRMKQIDIPVMEGWFNLMCPRDSPKTPRFKVLCAATGDELERQLNECVGYKFIAELVGANYCVLMEREIGYNQEEKALLNLKAIAAEKREHDLPTQEGRV
jgi:hypothetical protein